MNKFKVQKKTPPKCLASLNCILHECLIVSTTDREISNYTYSASKPWQRKPACFTQNIFPLVSSSSLHALTCSSFLQRPCHWWSTRCWGGWPGCLHSSASSASHTPAVAVYMAWAVWGSQHPPCTSFWTPHWSVWPEPHQSHAPQLLGHKMLLKPETRRKELWNKQDTQTVMLLLKLM